MKINVLKMLVAIAMLYLPNINLYAQGCNHSVRGIVIEAENNEPIAFAEVFVEGLKKYTFTDEKGEFRLENLCNGVYVISVRHIECKHETRAITVSDEGAIVNFALHHDEKLLGTVTVSAQSVEARAMQANRVFSGQNLEKTRGESLGELLKNIPGVMSLNTGATVSKPVIQGMHSNRVLIFNNGVRQEGQQWGMDHAPEIDPFVADKITVVKGAGSVQYGADAIGGIVLVEPNSLPQNQGIKGNLSSAFFSNGRTLVSAFMLENCLTCGNENRKFAWRIQGSIKRGGNLQTPDYYLANTGLSEQNFSIYTSYKTKNYYNSLYFSRVYSNIGIFKGAHIGNLDDLYAAFKATEPAKKADFTYTIGRPLQRIAHDLLKWKNTFHWNEDKKIVTTIALQNNRRGEFDAHRLFGNLSKNLDEPNLDFRLFSGNVNSVLEHQVSQNIHGKAGVDVTYQRNRTAKGGLIPNYVAINNGVFLTERWHRYDSPWELEMGLRYDYKWLNVAVRNKNPEDEGKLQQFDFQSFAGQIGAIYNFSDSTSLSFSSGTAWRNPSVNELFSLGVHHGTASFERGNANLKSERAFNNTLSYKITTQKLHLQVDAYANYIHNYIYLKPDSVAVLTIRGAFPAFNYTQTNALIMGFDWLGEYNFYKHFFLENKGSLLRASNQTASEWLILMPANRTQTTLSYKIKNHKTLKNSYLSLTHLFVAQQNRVPENQDYVVPPSSYSLFGIDAGTSFFFGKKELFISIGIRNALNESYRDYLNRFRYFADEIGRDVQIRAKFSF